MGVDLLVDLFLRGLMRYAAVGGCACIWVVYLWTWCVLGLGAFVCFGLVGFLGFRVCYCGFGFDGGFMWWFVGVFCLVLEVVYGLAYCGCFGSYWFVPYGLVCFGLLDAVVICGLTCDMFSVAYWWWLRWRFGWFLVAGL